MEYNWRKHIFTIADEYISSHEKPVSILWRYFDVLKQIDSSQTHFQVT